MKKQNKEFIQRLIALLLIVILIGSSTSVLNVLAVNPTNQKDSVTQPQGNANPGSASGNGTGASYDYNVQSFADTSNYINSRAYLMTIIKVENHALLSNKLSPDYISAKAALGDDLTQVAFSSAYEYLTKYPACFSSSSILTSGMTGYALVGVKDNNGVTSASALPDSNVVYASANGNMSSDSFQHVYIRSSSRMGSVNSSWKPTDLTRSNIMSNTEVMTRFLDGQLTLAEVKGLINTGNMSAAVENVIKPLADSAHLTSALNGSWSTETTTGPNGKPLSVYYFYLLDYLLAINNMCGNAYDELIGEYLATLNCDGFDSFVVPMIAVCQIHRVSGSTYACSTLPDMLGLAGNGNYVEIPGSLDGSVGYTTGNPDNSTSGAQMSWSKKLMDELAGSKSGRTQIRNYCMNWWAEGYGNNSWRGYKWAFSICPTDIYGKQTGSIGYTYLSLGGTKTIDYTPEPPVDPTSGSSPVGSELPPPQPTPVATKYQFRVSASSDQNIVGKGTQVAAKVEIDMGIEDWGKLAEEFLQKGDPTLVIATQLVPETGTGTSPTLIDQIVKPAGGAKTDENHMTWSNISWDTIAPYALGKQKITYMDSGITITEKTKNLYAVSMVFIFPGGTEEWFYAAGKITYEDNPKVGADRVSWGFENEDVHYYSSIGKADIPDNYVEIKEGAPGSESYEAMAGVPTTENLYVGFGATEFMVNMDGELGTSSGTRFYKYEYKNPQCYGHDVPCVLSCAGGHFSASGGCGKAIAWDSHGNATKYCDSGHYSINDDDCSDGKWQYEWVCSCSGKVLASGSGKAPMHQGEVCIGVDGSTDDNGGTEYGCKIVHHFNTAHPGATIVYTIQQPIDTFNYLNITAADIWRISELKADLNGSLFVNAKQQKETGTGAWSYINQSGYASNNGRLLFKNTQTSKDKKNTSDVTGSNNTSIWGDSYCDHTESVVESWESTATKALAWAAAIPNGDSVQAMVVSDYIELGTTEGYNHIAYHTYTSNVASLTPSGTFTSKAAYPGDDPGAHSGVEGQTMTAQTLVFPTKTIQDFWYNNSSDCASDWTEYDVTRSGYNGKYNQPGSKWNNNNTKNRSTTKLDTVMKAFQKRFDKNGGADAQPNQKHRAASGFTSDGFGNTRFTFLTNPINNYMEWTGSNIKNWPALQNKRVKNGEWDTGRCYIKAEHFDTLSSTEGGIDYSGYENWTEVGYTQGKTEVNDIVIFNPVSAQLATVITNDSKYDQRSNASLIAGGDPENKVDFCPGDSSCQYQILTCNEPLTYHTDACYTTVTRTVHAGGYNQHEHVSSSSTSAKKAHVHDASCYQVCYGALDTITVYHKSTCTNVGSYEILEDCTSECGIMDGMQAAKVTVHVKTSDGKDCPNKYEPSVITQSHTETDGNGNMKEVKKCEGCYTKVATYAYRCKTCETIYKESTGVCQKKKLICTTKYEISKDVCTHVHSFEAGCYIGCPGSITTRQVEDGGWEWVDCGTCGYNPCIRPERKWVSHGSHTEWYCTRCGWSSTSPASACGNRTLVCPLSDSANAYCSHVPNKHVCTSACKTETVKTQACENPHHVEPGTDLSQINRTSAEYHYSYGDTRCWTACHDDSKHKNVKEVTLGDGSVTPTSDIFVNLDREFWIYYPDTGDFAQSPSMHGILETTSVRGMGYVDNMDCFTWTRDKYVIFPFAVITDEGYQYAAYTPIDLYSLGSYAFDGEDKGNYYKFYCSLNNSELANAKVSFVSISSNAEMIDYYDESVDTTNRDRVDATHASRHTGRKDQYIDVIGSIGALTLEDTGDFRFATLFKQEKKNGTWLIENLVPQVNLKYPNKILSDDKDLRNEDVSASTLWHDAYSTQYSSTGGKAYKHVNLPLTPADNPIPALKKQPMRPGYNLYMDISTVGNYYGENFNAEGGYFQDSTLTYKMQILPRYWLLNLDTNKYTPLDVYMGQSGHYTPVAYFNYLAASESDRNNKYASEYYLYLDWQNEYQRRNFTSAEKSITSKVAEMLGATYGMASIRVPGTKKDILGTAQALNLNDINRTFIGSSTTYKTNNKYSVVDQLTSNKNPQNAFPEETYGRQAQRWNWTIGLPSSSVFVEAGKDCTTVNIEAISSQNAVIICTLQIYVKGTVWTLAYDGTAVNNVDSDGHGKTGVKIFDDGPYKDKVYTPPVDPKTGKEVKDPIVSVYSNDHTSADDLRTEGSH